MNSTHLQMTPSAGHTEITVVGSVAPGGGTYIVGACLVALGIAFLTTATTNGWVQVTN